MKAKGKSLDFTSVLNDQTGILHRVLYAVLLETSFSAELPPYGNINEEIKINVTKCCPEYDQVSAMLTNDGGGIVAYGKIGDSSEGIKHLKIPEDIMPGPYTLIVFGEGYYAKKSIDLTSNVIEGAFYVSDGSGIPQEYRSSKFMVNIICSAGLHLALTEESGELTQTVNDHEIDNIVIKSDEGYYFPEDYLLGFDQINLNGLEIIRSSDTTLTISGQPTDDLELHLLPAMEILNPEMDIVIDAFSCCAKMPESGELCQNPDDGVINPVILKADEGYFFPENYCDHYSLNQLGGVTIERTSASLVTIGGAISQNVEIAIVPASKTVYPNVEITLDWIDNIIMTSGSGELLQTEVNGSIEPVALMTTEAAYFPEDYLDRLDLGQLNGLNIERLDDKTVVISGTPTSDALVNLISATTITYPTLTIHNDDFTQITSALDSGALEQLRLIGAIDKVILWASESAYFPEDYLDQLDLSQLCGLTIERTDDKTVIISGTPTGEAVINLVPATSIVYPNLTIVNNDPNQIITTLDSGALEQLRLTGAIDEVILRTIEAAYFPEEYLDQLDLSKLSGLTIDRPDEKTITISGTPTCDAVINLAPATAIVYPNLTVINNDPTQITTTLDSGTLEQFELTSAIDDVVLQTSEDAYFPEDYLDQLDLSQLSGLNIERNDDKTIIISGTPTSDAVINLVPATAIVYPNLTIINKDVLHVRRTVNSGDLEQAQIKGAIEKVVLRTSGDYYFTENYLNQLDLSQLNGLEISLTNEKTITITGTPTADVVLSLLPATKIEYPSLTIINDDQSNIYRALDSGELWQSEVKDAIEDVILIAAEGYFFPDNYSFQFAEGTLNDLRVTHDNETTVRIRGKLSAHTTINLPGATRIPHNISIKYNEGMHFTKAAYSGKLTQVGVGESIDDIVFHVDSGYYFPDNYADLYDQATLKGLKIIRSDQAQITITGVPSGDVMINLLPALRIAYNLEIICDPNLHLRHMEGSGELHQTQVSGLIEEIVIAPAKGYHIPENYAENFAKDDCHGIEVIRNSEAMITIAGKLNGHATIELLPAEKSRYSVSLICFEGFHLTKTTHSGSLVQNGLTGAIEAVSFVAEPGFYFPEDYCDQYEQDQLHGLIVKRESEELVTVMGTADQDTEFYLKRASRLMYSLTIECDAGKHLSKSSDCGELIQTDLNGRIEDVIFIADKGYYFPEDYPASFRGADLGGLKVNRVTKSMATVSGIATCNCKITMAPASMIAAKMVLHFDDNAHFDLADDSGALVQENLLDQIEPVKLVVHDGYRFNEGYPERYEATELNGLTISRDNDAMVTISGRLSDHLDLVLLPAGKPAFSMDIVVTEASHLIRIPHSGELSQHTIKDQIDDVVFTVEQGYHIPADYPNRYPSSQLNGLEVFLNSDTILTISGNPTANTVIELCPTDKAEAGLTSKIGHHPPFGLFGSLGGVTSTTLEMEYARTPGASQWQRCHEGFTSLAHGTWYIRYAETLIYAHSEPVEVQVLDWLKSKPAPNDQQNYGNFDEVVMRSVESKETTQGGLVDFDQLSAPSHKASPMESNEQIDSAPQAKVKIKNSSDYFEDDKHLVDISALTANHQDDVPQIPTQVQSKNKNVTQVATKQVTSEPRPVRPMGSSQPISGGRNQSSRQPHSVDNEEKPMPAAAYVGMTAVSMVVLAYRQYKKVKDK